MSAVDYWERQYNPRLSVADAEAYFASWRRHAADVRAALPPRELVYGEHSRERLDLFRARVAQGTLVFIHGGYWRAFGKEDLSWIAAPFVAADISVAVLGYPLCPEVTLSRIGSAILRAMECLIGSVLTPNERRRIVLAGHSAGGHLAACYQANRSASPADAIVCISGLFDLLPLRQTRMLQGLNLQVPDLHVASPLFAPAPESGRVLLAVGGEETAEFHWQSQRMSSAWHARSPELLVLQQRNHFSVVEALAEPSQPLFQETLSLLR